MKNIKFHLLVLLTLLIQGCGSGFFRFPAVVIPPQPTAADFPGSGAVVLNDVRSVDFRLSETRGRTRLIAIETHHRRMKVLSKHGLKEATISLSIDGFSTVTKMVARAVRLDGRVIEMPRNAIRNSTGVDSNPNASQLGQVVFTIPGAQVGGIIEYYYERVYTEPDMIPVWVLGDRLPVLRSELSLSSDPFVKFQYRFGRGPRLVDANPLLRSTEDGRDRLVFVESNLPVIHSELGSPHPAWLSPWVAVVVSSAQIGGRKYRMETWAHVGERIDFLAGLLKPDAVPTTGSAEERFETIRDALNPVLLSGLGVLAPTTSKAIAEKKPICSRDASAILVKALKEAGEDAHIALIAGNSGPPVLDGFPGLYPFIRAVVAVDVHKRLAAEASCSGVPSQRSVLCSTASHGYTFIDPLCKTCRFGELPNELTGGRALILSAATPEWVDVPIDPPERNFSVIEADLSASLGGSLNGTLRIAAGGEPSRGLERIIPAEGEQESNRRQFQREFESHVGAQSPMKLTKTKWANVGKEEILKGESTMESKFNKLAYDRFEVRARDLTGFAFPWKWRRLRHFPRILEAPFWRQASATVRLPVGFVVDVRPPIELKNRFGEFSAAWRVEGNILRYWRSFILRQQVILPHDWKDFNAFLDGVRRSENEPIGIMRTAE